MKKTIFITGASTGIGRATALHFHDKGWNVVATMRSPEKEGEFNEMDGVLVQKLDVLDIESIQNAVEGGIAEFGRIDVLLNNAGYGAYGPLEVTPRENVIRQFNTNVIGLMDVTKAVIPHFRANMDGVIINVSSIGGKMTFPMGSLYHGTKFAVEGISDALQYEMGAIGVKVKIVEPGMIQTDFGGRSFNFNNDESVNEYQPMIQSLMTSWEAMAGQGGSPASAAAQVIWEAATDSSSRLRYRVGEDAEQLLDARASMSDDEFSAMMKSQFGL